MLIKTRETRALGAGTLEKLAPALEFIERHYATPLTLESLARAAGMTPQYL